MSSPGTVAVIVGGPLVAGLEELIGTPESQPDLVLVESDPGGLSSSAREVCKRLTLNMLVCRLGHQDMISYAMRLKDAGHRVTVIASGRTSKFKDAKSKAALFGLGFVALS